MEKTILTVAYVNQLTRDENTYTEEDIRNKTEEFNRLHKKDVVQRVVWGISEGKTTFREIFNGCYDVLNGTIDDIEYVLARNIFIDLVNDGHVYEKTTYGLNLSMRDLMVDLGVKSPTLKR